MFGVAFWGWFLGSVWDSDFFPRFFGGVCARAGGACARVAGLLVLEFDATRLIKQYRVHGTRLGHIFGHAKIGAPGRGDGGNE